MFLACRIVSTAEKKFQRQGAKPQQGYVDACSVKRTSKEVSMSNYRYWMHNRYPRLLEFVDQFTFVEWVVVALISYSLYNIFVN